MLLLQPHLPCCLQPRVRLPHACPEENLVLSARRQAPPVPGVGVSPKGRSHCWGRQRRGPTLSSGWTECSRPFLAPRATAKLPLVCPEHRAAARPWLEPPWTGHRLSSHLLSPMGFSEPCDTKIQRQGLCPWGSPRGKLSSHTEGRRGTRPSERGRGSEVTGGHTLRPRRLGGRVGSGS